MIEMRTHCRRILLAAAVAASSAGMAWAQPAPPAPQPASAPTAEDATPAKPRAELTAETMYRLLVGDVALQRGDLVVAARAYLEAARDTGDAALARRATEIGLATRQRAIALEAARQWEKVEPDAERPRQLVKALSASGGSVEALAGGGATKAEVERALAAAAASPEALAAAFLELNRLFAHETDKAAAFRTVSELAQLYPNVAEAHFAVALAGYASGLTDLTIVTASRVAIDRALAQKPGWERAVLLKSEILNAESPDVAAAYLQSYLQGNPGSRSAAGALAQIYVGQKRYAEARAVFEALWATDKGNRDVQFGLAVLAMQGKDWKTAEALFEDLDRADYGETGVVETYLAQIAEETGRYQLAFDRYLAVPDSERGWLARLRAAAMLGKLDRVAEAKRYLADLPAVTQEQRIQVRQAEAQLLRDAGDVAGAFAVLEKGLAEHPDDPDLLYDSAMVAEKLDRLDVVEARLTRLIEQKPDSAQALNSLGYTLVDRTPRVAEGFALIERAHKLSPKDPFILDSMGWALFRLGRLDAAEEYLRRAYAERPDAEIAAHLGEVLWVKGERDRAREVWQSQLGATPESTVLVETMRRLMPASTPGAR
jgi:tetratricopeptide (TPR) repeat protein